MKLFIPLYKQGFLTSSQLEAVKQKVANWGVTSEHVNESIQDTEISVYLKWLSYWVDNFDDQSENLFKKFVKSHPGHPNPLLGFLVSKYGQQEVASNIEEVLQEVLAQFPTSESMGELKPV